MHHERCDGSGYPSGLTEEGIDDFAKIIAIADVYDAMTAARSYRAPLCAFQVISNFEQDGYQKYQTKYILTFLKQIATTYQSNRVVLSDGRGCKIVMLNQNDLSRPIVQFDDMTCLDLSTNRDLHITSVI
jgi:HD-GYP domain-containing protein (c-di-GMP phosphodiesterase class II)